MKNSFPVKLVVGAFAVLLAGACVRHDAGSYQGYVEGEFVYVASPLAGRVDSLAVQRGAHVEAGTMLFTLERSAELAAQRQAAEQLRSAQSRLDDLKKGLRPSELAALQARLTQARATTEQAKRDLDRAESLFETKVIARTDLDHAQLSYQQNAQAVDDLTAQLETAQLGARTDAIAAAEADVSAAIAAKQRADWNVDQKSQAAARAALVYDTLYREGEFVPAGTPVVALLPPENIKLRFFVPEHDYAGLKAGDTVNVAINGRAQPVMARISYLSPQPEYTPPILYNRENRAKLLFMIEATFDPAVARDLHPGQPVDVTKI